jgi:hypothetical protein
MMSGDDAELGNGAKERLRDVQQSARLALVNNSWFFIF